MPNYTLDDFYSPYVISFTQIIMNAGFILEFIMLPFVVYAIVKKSRMMKIYRWYLLNGVIWNASLVFLYGVVNPVLSGTFPILLINSFFEYWFSIDVWFYITECAIFCLINTAAGLSITIGYRVIHLLNLTQYVRLLEVIDNAWFFGCVFAGIQCAGIGVTYVIFGERKDDALKEKNYKDILEVAPFLENIFRTRRIIGKRPFTNNVCKEEGYGGN